MSTAGLSLVAVNLPKDNRSLAVTAHILQTLNIEGLEVLMFSQSFSEKSLNLIVRMQDQSHALRVLGNSVFNSEGSRFTRRSLDVDMDVRDQIGIVSVVGLSNNKSGGLLSHAYGALGKAGT
jgi:aspartokinase